MTALRFETETCFRCGGTGHMPFAAYGGKCFKCHGHGKTMTAAGRSARKLYDELTAAACTTKQAWEVEVGETVAYASDTGNRWFTVAGRDFSSTSGSVVDGRCMGSAVLITTWSNHMAVPDTLMKVRPSVEARVAIINEVARRRKGAVIA